MMNDASGKDQVFAKPLSSVKAFKFDESVSQVFQDMISRSVPGYDLILRLIGLFSNLFVTDNSRVYDLGCSLGEASVIVASQADAKNFSIVAVDNASSMIEKCRQLKPAVNVDWRCENIQEISIENASMVILNLTLQFIDQTLRQKLLERIFYGLNPGGVLILSEKVILDGIDENRRMIELHQAFKKTQGYSDLEISQKRTALENILVPDLESELETRLNKAGFKETYQCFRCFNFVSYLAIKS